MAKIEINSNHITKLKRQRRTVGLLQFEDRDENNFSKWYSLTENLVIKAFGQKSNQLEQLQDIYGSMHRSDDDDWHIERRADTKEVKEKLKNLLSVFVAEMEMDIGDENSPKTSRSNGTSIKIKNTQTVNQTFNISVTIENIIENIKQTEPDEMRAIEAEKKLKELENEMKSKSPAWSKVKDILIWLLNFGRDTFVQVLPIILEKYKP